MSFPTTLTEPILDSILEAIRNGAPVRRALREYGVNPFTFYTRVRKNEGTCKLYDQAKQDGLDALADEIIELSDLVRRGVRTKRVKGKDGEWRVERITTDMVERAKVQIDARKWLLSKLAPKKFGEHLQIDQRVEQVESKQIEERLIDGRRRLSLVR
jgi:flavin-dependent dehydrogenase